MPTQFANTLNNHPIYADRAEKDAAGNTITTTYQKKLTAGSGITIDSSNVISATGGGGGTSYTAGTGIDISAQDAISVKIDGSTITTNGSGQLVSNGGTSYTAGTGIDISAQDAISVKIDGSTITTNGSGQLVANGGGGTSYTAGTGIDIISNIIGVKIDGSTITTNSSGQLVANNGGGGGGSGLTVGSAVINGSLSQDQHLFTVDGLSVDFTYESVGGITNQYISVSSSTVSTAYIDKRWSRFARADGAGNLDRWMYQCLMPNSETSPYTGVSLSYPCHLIDISLSSGTTDLSDDTQYAEYPTSFDFRIYYEVNNTAKVIYLNMFIWSTGQSNGSYNVRYSYSHG